MSVPEAWSGGKVDITGAIKEDPDTRKQRIGPTHIHNYGIWMTCHDPTNEYMPKLQK